jgi:stage V sporulation protein D (sporulation-specific penicillin-binding protein)
MESESRPRNPEKKYRMDQMIQHRAFVLMLIFGFAMFFPLIWKLYDIAVNQNDTLGNMAINQSTGAFPVTAGRGTIYDRNRNVLAISASVETVCISPRDIPPEKEDIIADGLSAILDVDRDMIVERMGRKNRANEVIKRNVEREKANEVREFIIENRLSSPKMVFLEPSSKRYYPNGSFSANVIGFVNADNSGSMGLEAVYEKYLSGTPGQTVRARTGRGMAMPNQYEMYYDAIDGYDLVLTIDETIQHFVEKHLETAVIENEVAERGCVIVMDPRTGGILAMATKGDFDLNAPREISDEKTRQMLDTLDGETRAQALGIAQQAQWRNKAINDTYEPGSVFKIITAAMAMEENLYNLETARFNCAPATVGGFTIHCHSRVGHGSQTFMETLVRSCNPAYIDIGFKIGPEKFYDYMRAFGFMDRTGIDLQGEPRLIEGVHFHSFSRFSREAAAQAVYSFGQTFKVTPIQMITAVSAVANGGTLMRPHILSQVLDSDGRVIEKTDPVPVRQVISAETSKLLREYLEECVNQGTGSNAYVKGYHVAGKTGTSQKRDIDNADELGLYVVSFAGFAPSHDPQVVILVMLDEPGGPRQQRMGGFMAAPVAGRILADVLPYLGIVPQYKPHEAMNLDMTVPFVKRAPVSEAKEAAENAGLTVQVAGDGDTVTDQLPAAGVRVPQGTEMILYTEGTKPEGTVVVPNVRGMTPEQANAELTNAGVFMRPIGALPSPGAVLRAAWQEYTGMEVPYGTVVSVEFRSTDVGD